MRSLYLAGLVTLALRITTIAAPADRLILITLDGVRCQEIFQGMDRAVWQAQNEGKAIAETELYTKFWADTPEDRRRKLLPFFWDVLLRDHGAIVGNRFAGNPMKLTNRHQFSYPGYSEILTGVARDLEIKSNDKIQNPHPTVLEFFREQLHLPVPQVAAFACWEVMDWIVESRKGTITSNAGFEAYASDDPFVQLLSRQQFETPTPWNSVRHDSYTFRFALAHLKTHQPRVLYLSLGETDDWSHDKRYDRVLEALHRDDAYFRELWEWLQAQEDYRDRTAIFIGTDHGRGDDPLNWTQHNDKLEGAGYVWFAAAGAGITARGELKPVEPVKQNQVAATLARALGLDYGAHQPAAGKPIEEFFRR